MLSQPFEFLNQQGEVTGLLAALRSEGALALDLEADSLHSYREKICLVQLSTQTRNLVLDPLAVPEVLDGLLPLLGEARIRKVLHGGDYDIRLLKRQRGAQVRNLFDTMIAAQLTGRPRFGLAALLEEFFGVVLDKRFQKADWSRRPLGPDLLSYAAADTGHLFALAERLAEELVHRGRLAWAAEEFRLLEQVTPAPPKPPWCLDVKGAGRLAPRELARLQALLAVREESAREWNRPPFKVLSSELLIGWAKAPPRSRREIAATPAASAAVLARVADAVLEALGAAEALPEEECPRAPAVGRTPLSAAEARRLARMKAARETAARGLGLEPGLLVNGATLERLAREEPQIAVAALPTALKGWQREVLGDALGHALMQ